MQVRLFFRYLGDEVRSTYFLLIGVERGFFAGRGAPTPSPLAPRKIVNIHSGTLEFRTLNNIRNDFKKMSEKNNLDTYPCGKPRRKVPEAYRSCAYRRFIR